MNAATAALVLALATAQSPQTAPPPLSPEVMDRGRKMFQLAQEGEPNAQNFVGAMYDNAQRHEEAVEWYRKSAEQGNAMGQTELGRHYLAGEGVSQDYAEALKWMRKGGEQGNPIAAFFLSMMYVRGDDVPKDAVEVVKWARLAAEQDCVMTPGGNALQHCALARGLLSSSYNEGQGVPQDYVLAYMWANLAAATIPDGDEQKQAATLRDQIARRMTPQQVAEGQQLVRQWKPRPSSSK